MVNGSDIKTPPLKDGCIEGVLRKKIIDLLERDEDFTISEDSISPFELQKADEIFLTNAIVGIQPITKYRKKQYSMEVSKKLIGKLNAVARLA